jgi:hypothetical protein
VGEGAIGVWLKRNPAPRNPPSWMCRKLVGYGVTARLPALVSRHPSTHPMVLVVYNKIKINLL